MVIIPVTSHLGKRYDNPRLCRQDLPVLLPPSAKMSSRYTSFIWYRSVAQLRSESSRAYLGYLWWVLEPLLYLAVFYVVFGVVFQRGDENYLAQLLIGLVVWKWFDGAVRSAVDVIQQNAGLIDKVYIPKAIFPLICTTTNAIKFMLVFLLLLLFLMFFGGGGNSYWALLPVLVLVQLLLVVSSACLVAAITPFLPDIRILLDKMMTLLFFLSGVFYSAAVIPSDYLLFFQLNPMFSLIELYRSVLIEQQMPQLFPTLYILVLAALLLTAGLTLLRRYDRVYPRLIV